MTLAEQYRYRAEMAGFREASDTFLAMLLAKDLMAGEPSEFKAGYTKPNAILAAVEVFPEADPERLEGMI